jgi:hypothetical protein
MKFLSEAISRKLGQGSLAAQENSPKILFGVGIVSMVGSTVVACRATLKLEEVLDRTRDDLAKANAVREMHPNDYSEKEREKDRAVIYARSGVEIAKLYAPAVGLGMIGVVSLTKSHNILNDRYTGMAAAYTALDKGFREYRQRVIDKYGEEQDQEFRYDTEYLVEGDQKGKKKQQLRVGPGASSIYARFFDPLSTRWSPEPEYNVTFLKCQQNYFNDILTARGHVFLNEVYDALGIPRSQAGQVVGWKLGNGDNYIDFGIWHDDARDKVRDFVNGREGSILLDFNVDGPIFDKIEDQGAPLSWQLPE